MRRRGGRTAPSSSSCAASTERPGRRPAEQQADRPCPCSTRSLHLSRPPCSLHPPLCHPAPLCRTLQALRPALGVAIRSHHPPCSGRTCPHPTVPDLLSLHPPSCPARDCPRLLLPATTSRAVEGCSRKEAVLEVDAASHSTRHRPLQVATQGRASTGRGEGMTETTVEASRLNESEWDRRSHTSRDCSCRQLQEEAAHPRLARASRTTTAGYVRRQKGTLGD